MSLYLSQIRLSRSPAVRALEHLVQSEDGGVRLSAQHQLLWSAFSEDAAQKRDFLWRAEGDGTYLTLSHRPPRDDNELFEPPRCKVFAPTLQAGDRLAFQLQANATRMKRPTRQRVDVVMDALHAIPVAERPAQRERIVQQEGIAWLARQGMKAGFALSEGDTHVEGYRVETLPRFRSRRTDRPQLGIVDITGILTVTEPDVFLAQLERGFGRAKAFGCGLMLIRRAS